MPAEAEVGDGRGFFFGWGRGEGWVFGSAVGDGLNRRRPSEARRGDDHGCSAPVALSNCHRGNFAKKNPLVVSLSPHTHKLFCTVV